MDDIYGWIEWMIYMDGSSLIIVTFQKYLF